MINHNSVATITNIKYFYSVLWSSYMTMIGTSDCRTENRRHFISQDKMWVYVELSATGGVCNTPVWKAWN